MTDIRKLSDLEIIDTLTSADYVLVLDENAMPASRDKLAAMTQVQDLLRPFAVTAEAARDAALDYRDTAEQYRDGAVAAEQSASSSATDAASDRARAETAASNAESSETAAGNSASSAASDASAASASATSASDDASAASSAATTATTQAGNASDSADAAALSAGDAADSEASASADAATATTKAGEAAASASEAKGSELAAANSADASQQARVAAEQARDQTQDVFQQFGDQYLGPFAADPTTDNSGNPLTEGDIYFNTTQDVLKFYSGAAWVSPEKIASNAAASAQSSADKAQQWASAPRDTAVEPGLFSAYHWAKVAEDRVVAGVAWGDVNGKPATATRWPDTTEVDGLTAALAGKLDTSAEYTDSDAVAAIKADAAWKAAQWNEAYSWGDHALAGYLKSVSWGDVSGKPVFSAVATSGAYADLSGKPTLGTAAEKDAGKNGNLIAREAGRLIFTGTDNAPVVEYNYEGSSSGGGWARPLMNARLDSSSDQYSGLYLGILGSGLDYTRGVLGFSTPSNWWSFQHSLMVYPDKGPTIGTGNPISHAGNLRTSTGSSSDYPMSQKAATDAFATKSDIGDINTILDSINGEQP